MTKIPDHVIFLGLGQKIRVFDIIYFFGVVRKEAESYICPMLLWKNIISRPS